MKKALVALCFAFLVAGCAHLQDSNIGAKTAIQFAALKVIDEDPERAQRVFEVVQKARATLDGDTVTTLDTVEQTVRAEIRWDRLDQAERLVVSNLIDVARAEIEERISNEELNPEEVVAVRNVLIWIEEAAQMAGGSADVASSEVAHSTSSALLDRGSGATSITYGAGQNNIPTPRFLGALTGRA